jgi:hypothetical protein
VFPQQCFHGWANRETFEETSRITNVSLKIHHAYFISSGGPAKANPSIPSYDVPTTARYQNHNNLHRPQSVGNPLLPSTAPAAPESSYIDVVKSPEELPSNSLPMIKYLEPSRSSPQDFTVTIPLERYSDSGSTPTGSSAGGDDVYEAMDGSNA